MKQERIEELLVGTPYEGVTDFVPTKAEVLDNAARVQLLAKALRFYADLQQPNPNEGPWGLQSSDFGEIARKALREAGLPELLDNKVF